MNRQAVGMGCPERATMTLVQDGGRSEIHAIVSKKENYHPENDYVYTFLD